MQADVTRVIERTVKRDGTSSASIAIAQDGKIVFAEAYGTAQDSPHLPALASTRYQLASISKTFTAQAILLLAARQRLSLEDPVSRWYPTVTDGDQVTLRHLLEHTSGLPDQYQPTYPAGPRSVDTTPDKIIAEWGHHPLLFRPGTRFHYSNLEYILAGRIVEKASGMPLFQFMQQEIFKPTQMTSVLDLDHLDPATKDVATGYLRTGLGPFRPAPIEGVSWSFGSGQVLASARDIAKWDIAFLDKRLLPAKEAAEQVKPAQLADGSTYPSGLGLFSGKSEQRLRYYHAGQGMGFETINMIYPREKLAIVVLTNSSGTGTAARILDQLTFLLLPPTSNETFARDCFTGLQQGTLDRKVMSEDLQHFLTGRVAKDYMESLRPLGALTSLTATRHETVDGLETRDYDVSVEGKDLLMHMLLLPDGRLEDLTVTARY